MTDRVKHTAGFTLAELMMSIAIILILAAIAIPSIFNAQSNMRMVELNNAAQSIANAAQTQMTAMKVSGTWMAFLDDRAEGSGTYLLRDEARASNILTSLSVDSTVYDGDYVIVFDQDTASVTAVFYTDGKTGFFGQAPATTNAAQTYYAGGSGSSDQAARMANDPMIGYYEGTPSGATPEVALRNPVIWVDEETGCLMVQDPNITTTDTGTVGTTNTTIYIENKTKGISFVLSSLSNDTGALTVASSEQSTTFLSITAAGGLSDVLKQVTRGSTAKGNVYSIDLNALSDKASASKGDTEEKQKLKDDIAQCEAGDDLAVRVSTEDSQKPSVPSKANANIKWPDPVGALTIMVTNPYSAAVNAEGKGAGNKGVEDGSEESNEGVGYTAPAVKAVAVSGGGAVGKKVTDLSEDTTNSLRNTAVNQELVKENNQAGYQSYLGASIAASSVRNDDTFRFQATVGSYASDGKTHTYQIWELWLKRADNGEMMRVGYLNDNAWEWAKFTQNGVSYDYSPLDNCFTWYDKDNTAYSAIAGKDTDALNIVTVAFNASAFYNVAAEHPGLQLADGDDNAAIYVRTAPKSSEVQTYFNTLATSNGAEGNKLQSSFLSLGTEETSSRGKNTSSTAAREAFEKEFGASSSDVSWVVSNQRTTGFDQGNAYFEDASFQNVRVYYSIAPGVGFQNIKTYDGGTNNKYLTDVRSTQMTNVSLWLYKGASYSDLQVMPAALLQSDGATAYTCRTANNYDFKLTTQEDYRFYRVLTYEGETAANIPSQYVPHISADNAEIATIAAAEGYEDDDFVYEFTHWTTSNTKTGGTLQVDSGQVAGSYSDLSAQGTTLAASYTNHKKIIGVMYLELGLDGSTVTGWYGYTSGDQEAELVENLKQPDNVIGSWGYYVVVPEGADAPTLESGRVSLSDNPIVISMNDQLMKAYALQANTSLKMDNQTVTYRTTYDSYAWQGTFTVNLNFAAAVAKGNDSPQTASIDNGDGTKTSAWNVRHPDQFPGYLSKTTVTGGDKPQEAYKGDAFLQTHHLDMADLSVQDNAKYFDTVFSGTYDGGGLNIANPQARAYLVGRVESAGEPNERRGSSLLFPRVAGTADSRARLQNIKVVLDTKELTDDTFQWEFGLLGTTKEDYTSVGLLAGTISDCDVVSCSVSGSSDANDSVSAISITHTTSHVGGWGILIGRSYDSTISSSSVNNIEMTATTNFSDSKGKHWGEGVQFGSIVGYASGTDLTGCSATRVAIGTTVVSYHGYQARSVDGGGIAGQCRNSSSLSGCDASLVTLVIPDAIELQTINCGGLVGTAPSGSTVGKSFIEIKSLQGTTKEDIEEAVGGLVG